MIEVTKIEDFVIEQIFLPYFNDFTDNGELPAYRREAMLRQLKRHPKEIIEAVEGKPKLKKEVMNRLKLFGGVEWYRYLDMNNPVIQWVNENLEESKMIRGDVYGGWNDDGNLEEIKNCPFCGGVGALLDNGYECPVIDQETGAYTGLIEEEGDVFWCQCEECGATSEESDTPEGAIKNRNRRESNN